MANAHFSFKQFTIQQDACAMKVTTDGCLFGAWVAAELAQRKKTGKALDIGTGTGLLSLMVAQQNKMTIDAVEIDSNAAKQAEENVISSGFTDINVYHADILNSDFALYDCIFSNPPFYERELTSPHSARAIAHHGEGLQLGKLVTYIVTHLKSDGLFFLLLPTKRFIETESLLNNAGLGILKLVKVKQTPKHEPFRVMLCGGKQADKPTTTEMRIREEDGSYSAAFAALLKDYYLYL